MKLERNVEISDIDEDELSGFVDIRPSVCHEDDALRAHELSPLKSSDGSLRTPTLQQFLQRCVATKREFIQMIQRDVLLRDLCAGFPHSIDGRVSLQALWTQFKLDLPRQSLRIMGKRITHPVVALQAMDRVVTRWYRELEHAKAHGAPDTRSFPMEWFAAMKRNICQVFDDFPSPSGSPTDLPTLARPSTLIDLDINITNENSEDSGPAIHIRNVEAYDALLYFQQSVLALAYTILHTQCTNSNLELACSDVERHLIVSSCDDGNESRTMIEVTSKGPCMCDVTIQKRFELVSFDSNGDRKITGHVAFSLHGPLFTPPAPIVEPDAGSLHHETSKVKTERDRALRECPMIATWTFLP